MFRQGIALFGPTQCLDMATPGWRVAGDGCGVYHARGAQHGRANKVYQALPGFLKKKQRFPVQKGDYTIQVYGDHSKPLYEPL